MAKGKMAKGGRLCKGDWADLAQPGSCLTLRVTPAGRMNRLERGEDLRCAVTAPPEDGRANDAVRSLLAHALGVAPSRLTLTSGATSRIKVFRLDP